MSLSPAVGIQWLEMMMIGGRWEGFVPKLSRELARRERKLLAGSNKTDRSLVTGQTKMDALEVEGRDDNQFPIKNCSCPENARTAFMGG